METLVVAGVDSVVGANLAASLADRFRVIGLSFSTPVTIAGCETACCLSGNAKEISHWMESVQPNWVIYCGVAAESTWQMDFSRSNTRSFGKPYVNEVRLWATAARKSNCQFAYISSDAVFTGPWMFHKESSACHCDSLPARTIRSIEEVVTRLCPHSLIVRTNALGWMPKSAGSGWLETVLDELQQGTAGPFDFQRYATPILATDLAEALYRAYEHKMEGVCHIAGSERVNPNQFVDRLASEFGLPSPIPVEGNILVERPTGFGCGETSLHTNRVRKELGMPMPTISDGIQRLREQKHNGYYDRLCAEEQLVKEFVA